MTLTTTAIGFLFLSLGLAFCGLRFFRAFQKIGGQRAGRKIGILLSSMFFSNAVTVGMLGIGALFFGQNPEILYRILVISHFPLVLVGILGVYLVFHILFPSVSPWPAMTLVFILGIAVIIITIVTHPRPSIDASGGIDFNSSRLLSVLLSYLLFIGIGSFFAIFSHSFLRAKSREVRVVSFVLAAFALMGIINTFVRYLFPESFTPNFYRIRVYDMIHAFIGIVFISVFVLPPIVIKRISRIHDHQS